MTQEKRLPVNRLTEFAAKVLMALDVPEAEAAITAACLIKAHLRGFDTHGLPCLQGYTECLIKGRINPRPDIKVNRPTAWSACLDGDNGLGQVAAHRAMSHTLETARELGIGISVVRRSNHFGAASSYALMALEHDCLGLVTSNASAVTAPFGASQSLLGTNPLSVAVPTGQEPPFVVDMATSEGSMKKVRRAAQRSETLPPGWALDNAGNPTVDPVNALKGVMLPFGGMKGSAITLLLDILSGVLSGAEFGGDVLSVFTNQDRESGNGHFMIAFKVSAFMPVEQFKRRMDEELQRIRSLQPAPGFEEVIYPGYKAHFTEQHRLEKGIPLEDGLIQEMNVLGKTLGVGFPD